MCASKIDYEQPEFYRFNEDSLKLVRFVCSKLSSATKLIDVGAGSGVIGIELALLLRVEEIYLLELQAEFEKYLRKNIELFIPHKKSKVFISSIGEFQTETKYDLIVSNPPYFLPGRGQLGKNPHRNLCRSFQKEGWAELLRFIENHLSVGGHAFLVIKNNSDILDHIKGLLKSFCLKLQQTEEDGVCFLQFSLAD